MLRLAFALAALATPALAAEDLVTTTAYACEGQPAFDVVVIAPADREAYAVIAHDGRLIAMKQAVSGSGVRYVPVDPAVKLELVEHQGTVTLFAGADGPAILDACPPVR